MIGFFLFLLGFLVGSALGLCIGMSISCDILRGGD